jgi:hypothetical protein
MQSPSFDGSLEQMYSSPAQPVHRNEVARLRARIGEKP